MDDREKKKLLSGIKNRTLSTRSKVILAILCVAVLITGLLSAKYIMDYNNNLAITAEGFYFTSDLLDGETHKISATNGGKAKISVNLMNSEDSLRYSDVDIEYTVTVSPSSGVTVAPSTGTLKGGKTSTSKININGLSQGVTYTVTATTENYYKKTLTGYFVVGGDDNTVYSSLRDGGEYINVTVRTKDYDGAISLTYPEGLIPDNTDSLMENWTTSTNGAVNKTNIVLGKNSSHTFRFFKTDKSKRYKSADGSDSSPVVISEK